MWVTLDDNMRKKTFEFKHDKVELIAPCLIRLNMHLVVSDHLDVLFLNLELGCLQDALLDALNGYLKL